MNAGKRVVSLSALMGLTFCAAQFGTEYVFGRHSLLTRWVAEEMSGYAVFVRLAVSVSFVLFGVLVARELDGRWRMTEALRKRNSELELLHRAGQTLSATLNPDLVIYTVLQEAGHLLQTAVCSIWLTDRGGENLVCRHASGPHSEAVIGWRVRTGEGIVGWVTDHDESVTVPDTRLDERHCKEVDSETGMEIRSILTVPLRIRQEVIGALQVMDLETDRFDAADLRLVEALASSAAVALENARLYDASHQELMERRRAEEEQARLIAELQGALAKVHELGGLIPICASCKRVRTDKGYWQDVAIYIREHSEAECTHGLCPDCAERIYDEYLTEVQEDAQVALG